MNEIDHSARQAAHEFGVELREPLGGRRNQHWLEYRRSEGLVLRRWACPLADIQYEQRLLARVAALGWPVAAVVDGPVSLGGAYWSLAPFLDGEPGPRERTPEQQRRLGQLLAEFHLSLATLSDLGQRAGWRRCEAILADPEIDRTLDSGERRWPDAVRTLRWHLERARLRVTGIDLIDQPGIIVHGDFAPWNLRFEDGRLSGILDFELAHWDHRVSDFALAWRGKYDDVILGYDEVAPLAPEEWVSITPLWWAGLIDGACRCIRNNAWDDGWLMAKLLQRSPLMGPDAEPFRA